MKIYARQNLRGIDAILSSVGAPIHVCPALPPLQSPNYEANKVIT